MSTSAAQDGAAALFAACFASQPEGIWYAPGRVNLIGEHTDYNEGFALPFAIGFGVSVAAARRSDGLFVAFSRQHPETVHAIPVDALSPGRPKGWVAYPAGVAWAMQAAGYPVGGVSLAVDGDLPPGAGLSSSAALECATGLALADLHDLTLPRLELAMLGRRAENDFVGAPTGLLDQLAVVMSRESSAVLLDCRAAAADLLPFDLAAAGLVLLVINTRVKHQLTDGGYGERRHGCHEAARLLGVTALRDVSDTGALARLDDPVLRRRARHVVTENQRVLHTAGLLRDGQLSQIGPALAASHASLRDDFEVSWPEADAAVAAAAGAGALGARMTGGGFGGSVIALVPDEATGAVATAVTDAFLGRGWQPPTVTQTRPAPGARRLR